MNTNQEDPSEPKCKKCKDEGRVITRMEAVHAPPAPMMMIKVYGPCPDGCQPKEGAQQ